MTKEKKPYLKRSIIILTIIFILTFTFTLLYFNNRDDKFTRQSWAKNKERRYLLANDLINSKILLGKDTNTVKEILGDPAGKPNDIHAIQRWTYYLGESNFMFKKSHTLIIRFDSNAVSFVDQFEIEQ